MTARLIAPVLRRFAGDDRWLGLFLIVRVAVVALAVAVLALQGYTARETLLSWAASGYAFVSVAVALRVPGAFTRRPVWAADLAAGLGLILASGDWLGPFYLLALTALAPPAAVLPFRRALLTGAGFTVAYLAVAVATGFGLGDVRSAGSVEILATRIALLGLVIVGVAYAADALRRLTSEQRRAQRLALEAERRRIAWELHDSAKQRLHAAHLVLSSQPSTAPLELVLEQLRGATADMDTSLAELHSPLQERDLTEALRVRAVELAALSGGPVAQVEGVAPPLPDAVANHAYRILAEALSNAVRHAQAGEVRVRLGRAADGGLHATVSDDGRGLPGTIRPGAHGLHGMRSRAFAIGARLEVDGDDGAGTRIQLDVPADRQEVPA